MRSNIRKIAAFVALACLTCGQGCSEDVVETLLGIDEPTALREADLPNSSRVVNCCTTLGSGGFGSVVPDSVSQGCRDTAGSAADAAITEYQRERDGIQNQSNVSEEDRASLLSDLRDQWQAAVEPGSRCFLEETVGTAPDLATPVDCESITTTGSLPAGSTCTDAIDALVNFSNTVGSESE